MITEQTTNIVALTDTELSVISGGTATPAVAGQVAKSFFNRVGAVAAIEWLGQKAYEAGRAFGRL
jgi:hypothetical protein